MELYDPKGDLDHRGHIFDATQYKTVISRFEAALRELPQHYPGLPIKFVFDFNKLNPRD